jgi:hypothetical protein
MALFQNLGMFSGTYRTSVSDSAWIWTISESTPLRT